MSPTTPTVTLTPPVPESWFHPGDFVADVGPDDLVYFLLNVGDGDLQFVLLPETRGIRRGVVVDVARTGKLPALIEQLSRTPLFPQGSRFAIVVGTHPHDDHIGGMAEFIDELGNLIDEYWEPGYYHPTTAFFETMRALEDRGIRQLQPTSGTTRFLGSAKVTALSPGIGLRNKFDSYGVDINNASISLMVEAPASRFEERDRERRYVKRPSTNRLLLGADAQTLSWGQVLLDFPQLVQQNSPVAKLLQMALGSDPLKADVFKIPHHASKRGVNLELVEAVSPWMCLVSSVGGGGKYNFPHAVSLEAIREAMEPIGATGGTRSPDHVIRIFHTHSEDTSGRTLGSIALVMSPSGKKRHLWRLRDAPTQDLVLGNAELMSQ
jgi:competence protein ComEC